MKTLVVLFALVAGLFVGVNAQVIGTGGTTGTGTGTTQATIDTPIGADMLPAAILVNLKANGYTVAQAFKTIYNGKPAYKVIGQKAGGAKYKLIYDSQSALISTSPL